MQQTQSASALMALPRGQAPHAVDAVELGHQWNQQHGVKQHQAAE